MHTREEKLKAFGRMLDVLDTLREKCPWDRKQTNESLRPNTIEETYELCDALLKDDEPNICKELGDVLLHVGFYARIGEEKGEFDIADVCDKLVDKLIYRHPHVYHPSQVGAPDPKPLPYGEQADEHLEDTAKTSQQVTEKWEQLKLKEKDGNKSVLAGVPDALPSLIKAYRVQDKARECGLRLGGTKAMCGLRCARNSANWRQNCAVRTRNALRRSSATSSSRSSTQHVSTR